MKSPGIELQELLEGLCTTLATYFRQGSKINVMRALKWPRVPYLKRFGCWLPDTNFREREDQTLSPPQIEAKPAFDLWYLTSHLL